MRPGLRPGLRPGVSSSYMDLSKVWSSLAQAAVRQWVLARGNARDGASHEAPYICVDKFCDFDDVMHDCLSGIFAPSTLYVGHARGFADPDSKDHNPTLKFPWLRVLSILPRKYVGYVA